MLRNLNTSSSGRRICGTSHVGIPGDQIPSTGTNGVSAIYPSLNLPTDAKKEYRLRLLTWPASGSLFMYEDGSLTFAPVADGTYTATGMLMENGVDLGSILMTWNSGVLGTIISCSIGNAIAAGLQALVQRITTINATVGNANAAGLTAIINTATSSTLIRTVTYDGGINLVVFGIGGTNTVVF